MLKRGSNIAKVNWHLLHDIFPTKAVEGKQALLNFNAKMNNKTKEAAQKVVGQSLVIPGEDRSFTYERVLGHPEMINSHLWRENSEQNC